MKYLVIVSFLFLFGKVYAQERVSFTFSAKQLSEYSFTFYPDFFIQGAINVGTQLDFNTGSLNLYTGYHISSFYSSISEKDGLHSHLILMLNIGLGFGYRIYKARFQKWGLYEVEPQIDLTKTHSLRADDTKGDEFQHAFVMDLRIGLQYFIPFKKKTKE